MSSYSDIGKVLYNPLFLAVAGLVGAALFSWYLFLRGPSLEKQNEMIGKQDQILSLLQQKMGKIEDEQSKQLSKDFPFGYILFATTRRNEIVPFNSPMPEILEIDWKKGYEVEETSDSVSLRMPNLVFKNPKTGSVVTVSNSKVSLPKIVGRQFSLFSIPSYKLVFKVISVDAGDTIIVMGLQ